MRNCIVAQSGGPTTAINASLAGIIHQVTQSEDYDVIYGSLNGITGILNNQVMNLSEQFSTAEQLEVLKTTPAMYLGSCRYKLPEIEEQDEIYAQIFSKFTELNIGAFFYIGGNDSMDTVAKLSTYAKEHHYDMVIIGVPKTIDNDLCMTDHTPGFGSAAKYVATSILEIAHDTYIYKLKSVTIVEIMGRDAGWLTAASALARCEYSAAPHLIYLPECTFSKAQFIADIENLLQTKDNIIVAVSEGIKDETGNYLSASDAFADQFGHHQLSGTGKYLEHLVKEKLGVKVRCVELNVLQRCAAHIASKTDLAESFALGKHAVALSLQQITGVMLIIRRVSNEPYQIEYDYAPIDQIANMAKSVPTEWITSSGNDVTSQMFEYLRPLILGECQINYTNGLPNYMNVNHLF